MRRSPHQRLERLPAIDLPGGLRVFAARTWPARSAGLARMSSLPADQGLWIVPCRSVHTFGMRFPLDLLWLDRDERVITVIEDVPPRRLRSQLHSARSVIEVPAGRGDAFAAAWPRRIR